MYFVNIKHFLLILFVLGVSCRPEVHSNFDVAKWSGKSLDNRPIQFSQIKSPGLVLNFYSPTCPPCIAELPALHALHREAQKKNGQMYIVLEGRPEAHGLEPVPATSPELAFNAIRDRMQQDIQKFDIRIPVLILDPPFNISQSGLITGTPETLFFQTNPLVLKYNFLGPLSQGETEAELQADSRFQFALQKL